MAKTSKCKKKSSVMTPAQRTVAENKTYRNKIAKLERQVRNNPEDHVAAYNLAIFKAEGVKAKGFAG